MNGMKNARERMCGRVEQMEDRINELEARNCEIIQLEANKEKNKKEQRKPTRSMGFQPKDKY